jgi:TnpA family transposase
MLQQACDILIKQKVEVPSYHTLYTVISQEMKLHQKHLNQTIEQGLTKQQKMLLNSLLNKDGGNRYRLTLLKRFSHSTKPAKIKSNIEDLMVLRELFQSVEPVVKALQLTYEGLKYYAYAALKFDVFQMVRRLDKERYLYLLAFITHQYYTLQDMLIDALVQTVTSAENQTLKHQREAVFATRKTKTQTIEKVLGSFLSSRKLLKEVKTILSSLTLSDTEKIQALQQLLTSNTETTEKDLETKAAQLQNENKRILKGEDYYDFLETQSLKLQNRVSEIVKQIIFNTNDSNAHIVTAIRHFTQKDGDIGNGAPLDFLKPEEQDLVFDGQGKLRISLYKILLFTHISLLVKSGGLNLRYSYRYRSFDEYLIPKAKWEEQKKQLLEQAGLTQFQDFPSLMKQLAESLHRQYELTNKHILKGTNQYIKFYKNGEYSLTTPKEELEETLENSIAELFPRSSYIPLYEVLATVNQTTCFLDVIEHWQTTHIGKKPQPRTLYAALIGLGCNIGIKKLAKISKNINQSELETTATWYLTLDNLMSANDAILAFIDALDLPKLFRKDQNRIHTSSDGQKYSIAGDSLNANYSFKYFGKGKGVTINSFIDESHRLFFSTVSSSSEREAAYVFDGLMHNEVVKSDIHSTDTHGYAEVIFAVAYLLGISFAPRIKGLQHQTLYSFERRKYYDDKGFKILPQKYINIEDIQEHWDDILRLITTIKLKETTASQIFKRFNSYSTQHILYQVLKAFGQIIKTQFILRYLDDVSLRQAIEKQLNKLESSNKFAKAVFHGNNQEFQQETKEEQIIAESCKRLIENTIICWNYLYLSEKLTMLPEKERAALLTQIKNSSIVIWHHINLLGEYDFSDERLDSSMKFHIPKILELKLI